MPWDIKKNVTNGGVVLEHNSPRSNWEFIWEFSTEIAACGLCFLYFLFTGDIFVLAALLETFISAPKGNMTCRVRELLVLMGLRSRKITEKNY